MPVARVLILAERTHVRDGMDLGVGPDFDEALPFDNGWWITYPGGLVSPTAARILMRRVGTATTGPDLGIYVAHAFRDSVDDLATLDAVESYPLPAYRARPAAAVHRLVWDGTDTQHAIAGEEPIS